MNGSTKCLQLKFLQLNCLQLLVLMVLYLTSAYAISSTTSFKGDYQGNISGQSATLSLSRNVDQVNGKIDIGGYIYKIQGNIVNNSLAGLFQDPNTGGQGEMSATQYGQKITMQIYMPGQPQVLTLEFNKSGHKSLGGPMATNQAGAQSTMPQQQYPQQQYPQQQYPQQQYPQQQYPQQQYPQQQYPQQQQPGYQGPVERDPALIGQWSKTDSYTSGQFSAATQFFLTITADGRYRYGDGKFAGGIGGVSGTSQGGDAEIGEWKTSNRIVYIRQNSYQQWQPFARYYVEGYSMMFTFGDGSKEIWKRSQ